MIILSVSSQKSHDALVPNGFGDRGVQGKILAATYVRSNGVSYLGIWLGMQLAVVEFARNVSYLIFFYLHIDVTLPDGFRIMTY